jgi:cytochrome c biogenesis protein CcmG/thiol:disulfide interchange protein DsbE
VTVRQQWTVVVGVIAAMAVAVTIFLHFAGDQVFLVGPGSRAPNFRAAPLAAPTHERTLADYHGQVVLLNVWATWCQPCVIEMPSIERLYHDYGPQGLKVVAISVDSAGSDSAVRAFAARFGLTFDVLRDPSHATEEHYQTTGYPETFVIGRDGVIRKKIIGASDWDSPGDRALIGQLLREPAA